MCGDGPPCACNDGPPCLHSYCCAYAAEYSPDTIERCDIYWRCEPGAEYRPDAGP
jgi:hypothetical protein